MRVFNRPLATAVPLNADYTSTYTPLKSIFTYSMAILITGTPTGTVQLQASNDPETNEYQTNTTSGVMPATGPTNWVAIDNSATSVTAAGNIMYNVSDVGYNYVRVQYTDGSGGTSTATATIVFNGKGV